jgi:hypothetical protein
MPFFKQGNRKSTELGYRLTQSELNDGVYDVDKMSVRLLAKEMGMNGEDIIIGPKSFGAFLDKHDVPSVPSPSQETPGETFWSIAFDELAQFCSCH